MNNAAEFAESLIDFIHRSPSPFHVTANALALLSKAGFERLDPAAPWTLERGGRYLVAVNGSAFIAFVVGTADVADEGFRVIQTHTDSPTIRIKPRPEIAARNRYLTLNAEVYGSPIFNTWLDRPLTMAGRVSLRGEDPFAPVDRLVAFDTAVAYIPNLSIHHNKQVNSGIALNPQKDLLPMIGMVSPDRAAGGTVLDLVAGQIGVTPDEILDVELSLSEFERGTVVGTAGEFISSTRLDNLSLLHAGVHALSRCDDDGNAVGATRVLCCVDNEEVGNRSPQGADSPMMAAVLERIALATGGGREEYLRALHRSFMFSADVSHALHPNIHDRSDPHVETVINGGVVAKFSGAQKFTSDSSSIATFRGLCEDAGVPWQFYANRADSPGGSAAGTASVTQAPMRSVDVGIPILAMHSIREMCGVDDNFNALRLFSVMFS